MKAGFSKVCISPPGAIELAGFAARKGKSTGIRNDIYVRALFLENGDGSALLMSADLLALPESFIERLRNTIHEQTEIARSAILVGCTHTHAAPVTLTAFFNPNQTPDGAYLEQLATAFEQCALNACNQTFKATIGIGTAKVTELGRNRRSANGLPVDEMAGIIRVDDANGCTCAVVVNYACHPTVLGPDNHLISGDFPAFAVRQIEASLGDHSMAMFLNGAEGDIGPGHSSELSAIGVIAPGRTFERATELGATLAAYVLSALPHIHIHTELEIRTIVKTVNLPRKNLPSVEAAKQMLETASAALSEMNAADSNAIRNASSNQLYASITNYYAGKAGSEGTPYVSIELQGIRIGHTAWLAVPAEVFVEIGLRLKQLAAYPTFLVAVANGYIGYLPTSSAFEVGGYEVVASPVAPDSEQSFLKHASDLIGQLF